MADTLGRFLEALLGPFEHSVMVDGKRFFRPSPDKLYSVEDLFQYDSSIHL